MVFWIGDGLVVGDGYSSKRHNARISVNTEVYDRLKLTGQMSYVDFYKKDLGYSGTSRVFRLSQRMSPLLPVMWQIPDEKLLEWWIVRTGRTVRCVTPCK